MQHFPETDPSKFQYDGRVRAVGFSLMNNMLQCYTIDTRENHPENGSTYRPILLMKAWAIHCPINGYEQFKEAITWFRNASEWAAEERRRALNGAKLRLGVLQAANAGTSASARSVALQVS